MVRQRKKVYVAWLANMTDRQDDEPIKIKARDEKSAREEAALHCRGRFGIRFVLPWAEFRKSYGGWARMMGKWEAIDAPDFEEEEEDDDEEE